MLTIHAESMTTDSYMAIYCNGTILSFAKLFNLME